MRCTARSEMPTALAMARPVQWVASPGGSEQVSARTRATASPSSGALAGLAGLVAQQAVDALLGVALLPAPDRRAADAGAPGDFQNREPLGGEQDDLGALDVLERTVTDRRRSPPAACDLRRSR